MSDCDVSVIIPAFNVAKSLSRTIDSVLVQNVRPRQVIVINDGSTDETAEVAASYGPRITYLEQENQGQGAARNTGLAMAEGQYVAFLDADDYWLPGFLAACVEFLDQNPEAVAVSAGSVVKKFGKPDRLIPRLLEEKSPADAAPRLLQNFFDFWASHDHVRTGSNTIRRTVIEEAGYQRPDLRISQDLEYWGLIATFGRWGFIPKPLFVTDGTPAAASQGWWTKYRARRKLCPTVEQWQSRIVPRLQAHEWSSFRVVRGRIAASFAHAKILAGDEVEALAIVERYGTEFSPSWSGNVMRAGARSGKLSWRMCCRLIRFREMTKSRLIGLTAARASRRSGCA